ncbi:MAG: NUDIX hydrolase [Nanobdellota archaeon]
MKTIRTVGVLVEHQGRILILHRNPTITEGGTWGLPAGKVNPGEDDLGAALRELEEETGYKASPRQLTFIGNYDWQLPDKRICFPTYHLMLKEKPCVTLNPREHQAYQWITPGDCYIRTDLIHGLHKLLEGFYNVC